MTESKIPAGLKIEHWYHAFVWLGILGAAGSAAVELHGIPNREAFLLSIGLFLIGVGEWMNHPLQTKIIRPNVYMPGGGKVWGHPRKNCGLGVLLDLAGTVLAVTCLVRIALLT